MDNPIRYGFRWNKAANGGKAMPAPEEMFCATSCSFDVGSGASNVSLGPGDPVVKLSDGSVTLCAGAEGTVVGPYGICVGVVEIYDVTLGVMKPARLVPSDLAWGTVFSRRSKILVVPITQGIWEIDCDDTASGYDTEVEYYDMVGENADFRLCGASGESRAKPRLDVSTNATTLSLALRIHGVSKTADNRDFSGNYVKMLVKANLAQMPNYIISAAASTTVGNAGV